MTGNLVNEPVLAQPARLGRGGVLRVDDQQGAVPGDAADLLDGLARALHVFEHAPEGDDVEGAIGIARVFQLAGHGFDAKLVADQVDHLFVEIDAGHVPAAFLHEIQEGAVAETDVEQLPLLLKLVNPSLARTLQAPQLVHAAVLEARRLVVEVVIILGIKPRHLLVRGAGTDEHQAAVLTAHQREFTLDIKEPVVAYKQQFMMGAAAEIAAGRRAHFQPFGDGYQTLRV